MRLFLSFCVGVLFWGGAVQAQPLPDQKPGALYCSQAMSTADFQNCVNQRLQAAQERLNTVFKELDGAVSAPEKTGGAIAELEENTQDKSAEDKKAQQKDLHITQKAWLSYRDSQCDWEKDYADPGTARINELACLADLSEDRAARLFALRWRDEGLAMPQEFGSVSRWMNVVSHENPDVFWRYGDVQQGDFDCDGTEEYVMVGLALTEDEAASPQPYVMIAIAENPVFGKPTIYNVKLPVTLDDGGGDVTLCHHAVQISVKQWEKVDEKVCNVALDLTHKDCPTVSLLWDGKAYNAQKELPNEERSVSE